MKIKVKLFATLRIKAPKKVPIGESFEIEVPENATINKLLDLLNISDEEAKIIMINHTNVNNREKILKEGDEVAIFPPVGGG